MRLKSHIFEFDKVIALYLGRENFWINLDRSLQPCNLEEKRKCSIVILGREHYSEIVETLPMTSMEDLKAAISFSTEDYFPNISGLSGEEMLDLFFMRRLGRLENGTEINIWGLDKDILKQLKSLSPLWVIPETALIGEDSNGSRELWQIKRPDGSLLLVGKEANGATRSILNFDQTPEVDSMIRLLGGEFPLAGKKLNSNEWIDYLCTGLLQGGKKKPSFFIRMLINRQDFRFRAGWGKRFGNLQQHYRTAIAVLLILAIFCGAQLFLPWYLNRGLAAKINKLKPSTNLALEKRNELKNKKAEVNALIDALGQAGSRLVLLQLIFKDFPEKGKINRIRCVGDQVLINGLIPDAGEYLKALGQDSRVKSARFKSPVQNDRKSEMEKFNLAFQFLVEKNEQK